MTDCIFCQIVEGKIPSTKVYQDDVCIAFMDIQPLTRGHVLVIPRSHAGGLADLPPQTGGHLFQVGQKIAKAMRKSSLKAEGINFFLADGKVAFQTVFHVHLHVIPRTEGDGFGLKFGAEYGKPPERSELERTAGQIQEALGK